MYIVYIYIYTLLFRVPINRVSSITTGAKQGTRHASNLEREKKFAHLRLAFNRSMSFDVH